MHIIKSPRGVYFHIISSAYKIYYPMPQKLFLPLLLVFPLFCIFFFFSVLTGR